MNILLDINNRKKELYSKIKDTIDDKKSKAIEGKKFLDIKKYAPIFKEDMDNIDLKFERMIRIVNHDKREDIDVCEGAIGFTEKIDSDKVKTFYYKDASDLGLYFWPKLYPTIYIKDPCFPYKFIDIDKYYDYMKQVRANELTLLAQGLGAREVNVSYREASKVLFIKRFSGNGKVGKLGSGKGGFFSKKNVSKNLEILSKTKFDTTGNQANLEIPEIMYFSNESDINALISMAKSHKGKLESREYTLKASSSSGVSNTEAANISATVKKINVAAGEEFEEKTNVENYAFLDYTIIF